MGNADAYGNPAAMLATVVAGVAWGLAGARDAFWLISPVCGVAAHASVGLMAVGFFLAPRRGPVGLQMAWAIGLAFYSAALILADPFCRLEGGGDTVAKMFLLAPLAVALRHFLHYRGWFSASGAAILLAASVALLVFNSRQTSFGCGFISGWVH